MIRLLPALFFTTAVVTLVPTHVGSAIAQEKPATSNWSNTYAQFVAEVNSCLKLPKCDLNAKFMDKVVTWEGTFKSLDESQKLAEFTMVPADAPVTVKGKSGVFACCALVVKDTAPWKAVRPGEKVRFRAILGKAGFQPLMIVDMGTLKAVPMLGDAELLTRSK